jgi:hypothetical protein
MFVAIGMMNCIVAWYRDQAGFPLSPERKSRFISYVARFTELFKARLSYTELHDFSGNKAQGILLDKGGWANYSDYAYAGYSGMRNRLGY